MEEEVNTVSSRLQDQNRSKKWYEYKIILVIILLVIIATIIIFIIFNHPKERDVWESASTFGNVSYKNEEFVITEDADAGFYLNLFDSSIDSINFEWKFLKAGDGDFLAVTVNDILTQDGQVLVVGPDLQLTREQYIESDGILIFNKEKKNQRIVFKLTSRGEKNAVLSIRNITITPKGSFKLIEQGLIEGNERNQTILDSKEINNLSDCDVITNQYQRKACYSFIEQKTGLSKDIEQEIKQKIESGQIKDAEECYQTLSTDDQRKLCFDYLEEKRISSLNNISLDLSSCIGSDMDKIRCHQNIASKTG